MSTQDDALDFQNAAIAAALDSVDDPSDALDDDAMGNNSLGKHDPSARRADRRERYVERPRLTVASPLYCDPDQPPARLDGHYLTDATRARDRSMLDQPLGKNAKSKKSKNRS